jgi:hypothetical protein
MRVWSPRRDPGERAEERRLPRRGPAPNVDAMALIEGTVVYRGAPVPEALVRATEWQGTVLGELVQRTVRTDVDGRFTLVLPKARKGWTVDATAGRRLRGARLFDQPRVRSATIELGETALVVVRVVAPDGTPVAGARVDAAPQLWRFEIPDYYYCAVGLGLPSILRPPEVGLVTNARGEVTLRITDARLHDLGAEHATLGRARVTVGLDVVDRDAPIVLQLDGVAPEAPSEGGAGKAQRAPEPQPEPEPEPPRATEPRVLSSSSSALMRQFFSLFPGPLKRAIVTVEFEGAPRPPTLTLRSMIPRTYAGSRRRILIDHHRGPKLIAHSGRWAVPITAPGFVMVLELLPPSDGLQRVTMTLGSGATLRGRVFDRKTEAPVAGAALSFFLDLSDDGRGRGIGACESTADGTYALVGVPPGKVTIAVRAPGHALEVVETEVGAESTTCNVGLGPEVVVAGRVEWRGDRPRRIQLELEPVAGPDEGRRAFFTQERTQTSVTSSDLFRVGGLEPGRYRATLGVGRFDDEQQVGFSIDVPPAGLEGLVLDVDALRDVGRDFVLRAPR